MVTAQLLEPSLVASESLLQKKLELGEEVDVIPRHSVMGVLTARSNGCPCKMHSLKVING